MSSRLVLFKDMFGIAHNFPNCPGFTQEAGVGVLFLKAHTEQCPQISQGFGALFVYHCNNCYSKMETPLWREEWDFALAQGLVISKL